MQTREERLAYMREYHKTASYKAARARYNASEKGKASIARYNKSEACKESLARYLKSEKGKAVKTRYLKTEKGKAVSLRHTNKRRGAIGPGLTADQWAQIKAGFSQHCAYCLRPCDKLEQDHVVPLSRGGAHDPTNIVPACRSCNSRKGTKDVKLGAYKCTES